MISERPVTLPSESAFDPTSVTAIFVIAVLVILLIVILKRK